MSVETGPTALSSKGFITILDSTGIQDILIVA